MNTTTRPTTRIATAAAAVATTWMLLSGVVSIAEPQRGVLLAKVDGVQHPAAAVRLSMASASATR